MDLLTVVEHELGHVLGLDDVDPSAAGHVLMTETLGTGVRRSVIEMTPAAGLASAPSVLSAAFPVTTTPAASTAALDAVFAALSAPTDAPLPILASHTSASGAIGQPAGSAAATDIWTAPASIGLGADAFSAFAAAADASDVAPPNQKPVF